MWDKLYDFLIVLICKCRKVSFPTFWMDSHMGPRTYGLKLLAIKNSWCLITLHPLLQTSPLVGTCLQNLCTTCAPFPSWPSPTPTSTASLHQIVWPLALPHLHHLGVVHVLPKLWAQLVTCSSPFERGWTWLRSVLSCCNKTQLIPNVPPNLVGLPLHNSLEIIG